MEDRCVMCGAIVPEGTMVCSACIRKTATKETPWVCVTGPETLPPEGMRVIVSDGRRLYLAERGRMYRTRNGTYRMAANFGNGAEVRYWMPEDALPPLPGGNAE